MPALLIHLLQASLVLTVLYGVYWAVLRKVTFYQLNRMVLLLTLFGSLLLPCLPVTRLPMPTDPAPDGVIKRWTVQLNAFFGNSRHEPPPAPGVSPPGGDPSATNQPPVQMRTVKQRPDRDAFSKTVFHATELPVGAWLLGLYLVAAAFFIGKVLVEAGVLFTLARTGSRQRVDSCTLIYSKACSAPLSFFKVIILNPDSFNAAQLDHIIRHEQVHARQWHSLDVLLSELFGALFWFHPLAYLLKKDVKLNLEYIADAQVLRQGVNRKLYQYNLLHISAPATSIHAANHFNFSHLKSRIRHMNTKPSPRQACWRYGLLLPAIALLLLAIQPMHAGQKESAEKVGRPLPAALGGRTGMTPLQAGSRATTAAGLTTAAGPIAAQARQYGGPAANETRTTRVLPASVAHPASNQPASPRPQGVTVEPGVPARVQLPHTTKASDLNQYLNLEADHNIYLSIRASSNAQELQTLAKTLRETGVKVTFSNVRYNGQRQLTRVRMQVNVGDCATGKACFAQSIEAHNQGEPLQNDKPLVFYLSRQTDQIGVHLGYPDLPANDLAPLRNFTGLVIGTYGSKTE